MKNDSKTWVFLAAVLIALLLTACPGVDNKETGTAILQDGEATPASHSLIRLQERQMFPVDDKKRQYAMNEDSKDKHPASGKPLSIEELKP